MIKTVASVMRVVIDSAGEGSRKTLEQTEAEMRASLTPRGKLEGEGYGAFIGGLTTKQDNLLFSPLIGLGGETPAAALRAALGQEIKIRSMQTR